MGDRRVTSFLCISWAQDTLLTMTLLFWKGLAIMALLCCDYYVFKNLYYFTSDQKLLVKNKPS